MTGDATTSALTDASGNYQFSSLAAGGNYIVTPTKTALTPASTGINTIDAIAVQRHFLVLGTPLSGCRLAAADVNGDTTVNTVDVIAIQRFFLGETTGVSNVGKYLFTPANRTYAGVVTDQNGRKLRHARLRRRCLSFCRANISPHANTNSYRHGHSDSNSYGLANGYRHNCANADSFANSFGKHIRHCSLLLESSPWPSAKCNAHPDWYYGGLDVVRRLR